MTVLTVMVWWPTGSAAAAEIVTGTMSNYVHPSETDGFDPAGLRIDSIVIDNRNIYDTDDPRYNSFLFKAANKLHIKTRHGIIERELLFEVGDTFDPEIALETARNLRVRFPFNDAWIETDPSAKGGAIVRVVTIDQWSLIGGVRSIDTDGNETNVRVGFEERNLLGRAQFLSFDYDFQEKDDNFVTTLFQENRILGRPYRLVLGFSNNPKNEIKRITIGRPFYNLAQEFYFDATVASTGGREERFFDGRQVAQWREDADEFDLEFERRWGPYHRKIGLVGEYEYVYKRISNRTVFIDTTGGNTEPEFDVSSFPSDSLYHQFNAGLQYTYRRFLVVKRINGFEYNEDFDAGAELAFKVGRAFENGFDDHLYDYAEFEARGTDRLFGNIVSVVYNRSFWFRREVDIRRTTELQVYVYNNQLPFMTVALRTSYLSDRSEDSNPLALGGKSGLRGYDTEFRTGDRIHLVNLETRFFPGIEILSVKLGAAAFADIGRTFTTDERFAFRDYLVSAGVGLRLSFEKWSRAELARIDLAMTRDGKWHLSLGTGQYF